MGGSTMLGGCAMKVARSGHGALRWSDDSGDRCCGPNYRSGKWHGGSKHIRWLLWCGSKGLLQVHGDERWWCHHVDCGIVVGMALGRRELSIAAVLLLVHFLPTMVVWKASMDWKIGGTDSLSTC
ncbi:unnamed protein product [Prunus armeniaca]